MATKQQEQQEEVEEQQPEQNGNGSSLHINVEEDLIVIELPRDGNEADTLSRLSQFVDGM